MVLIDTGVWITLYRRKGHPLGQLVWLLTAKNDAAICGQVLVEFLVGFRNTWERRRHERSLRQFQFLETPYLAYKQAADFAAEYSKLGSGDAIIAATALHHNCPLLTLDKDFNLLKQKGLDLLSIPE